MLCSGVANKNPPDGGRFVTARIKLQPSPKVYRHRQYQLQGERAGAMKRLVKKFIEHRWIEPSDREWASAAFIALKKEKGKWRLIVDYRGWNEQTEHDSYSLPLVDTILQEGDFRACTAMSTLLSCMQWKVVPMGVKNGNVVFQRMMENLLGHMQDCADPFVDDIIVGSGKENNVGG